MGDELWALLLRDGSAAAVAALAKQELALEEQSGFGGNPWAVAHADYDFYGLYMTVLLIDRDLNEAKYLWKRTPSVVKSSQQLSQVSNVWQIGKALWSNDVVAALRLIDATPWAASLQRAVVALRAQLVVDHTRLLHRTTPELHASALCAQLSISSDDLPAVLQGAGLVTDADGRVLACATAPVNDPSSGDLAATVAELRWATDMLAFVSQQPLKVELAAGAGPELTTRPL